MRSPSADPARPGAADGRLRRATRPWLAPLLALLCFANSIGNDFAYDDRALVLDNPRIRSLGDIRALWLSDWWALVEGAPEANPQRDRLYRPFTLFTFALNYAVHGYRPAGYHLVNVLLHAAVCLLVWHFARRLTNDAIVAGVAAAVFAVHPVHVEAVANVVGRAELLAALFLLGGLLVLQPPAGTPGVRRALAALPFFLLALLSKESAVCYPAIALLMLLWMQRGRRPGRRWWLGQAAVLLVPLLVYFPLRYVALEQQLFRTEPVGVLLNPLVTASGLARVLAPFTVLGHYVRLLLMPTHFSCDYGIAIVDPHRSVTAMTLLGMASAVGLAAGLCGLARRGAGARQAGVLTAMLVASYALFSNTFLLIGVAVAERFLYWPSVPALVLLATGIAAFGRRYATPGQVLAPSARLLRVLGVLLLAALGIRSAARNLDWADNLSLFGADVRTQPAGAQLNKGYATELLRLWRELPHPQRDQHLLTIALGHLDRAIQIYPGYVEALTRRGQVRAQLGDLDGALLDLEAAIQLDPTTQEARRTLAQVVYGAGADARLEALRAALATQPAEATGRLQLGRALLESGQAAEAQQHLEEAVRLAPDNMEALRELAKALAVTGKDERAIVLFEQVVRHAPDDWQAHANLTKLLAPRDPQAALAHARTAYQLRPGEPRNGINLAETYALTGQTARAVELYRELERHLDPDDPLRQVVAQRLDFLRGR